MVPIYLPSFISCLLCPTMNPTYKPLHTQRAVDIRWSCYQASAQAGAFTRHALPPSIPFSTRKSSVRKYSTVTSQASSSQVLQAGFVSLSSVPFQPFEQTPSRTHHCHYHSLFTSFPCTRQQTHMEQMFSASIILYERVVLLGGEITPINPHIFINFFGNRFL